MEPSLVLGSVDTDHLSLVPLGRAHPGSAGYWDEGWVRSMIEVRAGGFTAKVMAALRADEIHRFAQGLKSLNDNLFGVAVLESMEDWITLSVECTPSGTLDVSGEVMDQPGVGNRLSFELHGFDQTHLSSWLSQLSAIETSFPVVGES